MIESRTEDADDAAARPPPPAPLPATITAAPAAAPAAETPGGDDAPPTISKPIAELSAATRDLLKSMGMTPGAARVRQPWERAADRLEQYASSARDEQRQAGAAEKSYTALHQKRKSAEGLTPREEQRQADTGDGPKDVFSRLADAHFFTGMHRAARDAPVERAVGAEERGWDSSVNIMKGECAWSSKDEAAATSGRNSARGGPADGAPLRAPRSARGERCDREAMPPPPAPPREPPRQRPLGAEPLRCGHHHRVGGQRRREHEIDALVGVAP